jgi:hypothetical protein
MTKLICPKISVMNQRKDHFADLYDIKMNLKDIRWKARCQILWLGIGKNGELL